jgi:3-keto-L-gulonate-6-phosphate decarboxylase
MSEENATYQSIADELSAADNEFIEKGGVLIRKKGMRVIECITQTKQYWHAHTGCADFDEVDERDDFFQKLLEFADYKEIKSNK